MPEEVEIIIKTPEAASYTFYAEEKKFRTGSIGYYGYGKLEIRGLRYQVGLILTEIASKKNPSNNAHENLQGDDD